MNIHRSKNASGFTVVELLIALFISTALSTAAFSYLATYRTLNNHQEVLFATEENARYTTELLKEQIQIAGYSSNDPLLADGAPLGMFFRSSCGSNTNCTTDGAGSNPDSIAIWLRPEIANRIGCNGRDLSTILNNDESLVNHYYIDRDDQTGLNNLMCSSYTVSSEGIASSFNNNTNAILAGIENIQVQYGVYPNAIGSANPPTNPVSYVSADSIPVDGWGRISAVKISLLVSSGFLDGQGSQRTRRFQLMDAPLYIPNDGDICFSNRCQIFSSTINIENKL